MNTTNKKTNSLFQPAPCIYLFVGACMCFVSGCSDKAVNRGTVMGLWQFCQDPDCKTLASDGFWFGENGAGWGRLQLTMTASATRPLPVPDAQVVQASLCKGPRLGSYDWNGQFIYLYMDPQGGPYLGTSFMVENDMTTINDFGLMRRLKRNAAIQQGVPSCVIPDAGVLPPSDAAPTKDVSAIDSKMHNDASSKADQHTQDSRVPDSRIRDQRSSDQLPSH